MSKLVGRSDDEGIEGILIIGIGRFLDHLLDRGGDIRLLGRL